MLGWEPLLLVVAAVVLLAAVLWWVRRSAGAKGPEAGEIWWAEVPFTDGSGAKLRPCLVLLRHRRGIVVLKITSQDKSHRRDHVPIPTRPWDPRASHNSYLNLGEPIMVRPAKFQRRAGACDAAVLRTVRNHAELQPRALNAFARSAAT
jgi:hypothetical protein